jgi:CheY-like chemotaxis protein
VEQRKEDSRVGFSGYRVLIIDDEDGVRNLVVSLLSRHGHLCETANNGLEAVDRMEMNTFDAVITDIGMSKMDGISTTKRLLRDYPNLPILVMTGFTREYCIGSAIAAGARDFIKKPFSIADFMLSFNTMMRDQEIRSKIETRRNAKGLEGKLDARIEQLRFQVKDLKVKLPYICCLTFVMRPKTRTPYRKAQYRR